MAYTAEKCQLMGTWSATESGLVSTLINESSGDCSELLDAAGAFSVTVARYEVIDSGIELMDANGSVSATLTEADRSEWPRAVEAEYVKAELGQEFGPKAELVELPDGYVPPTAEDIVGGRWLPLDTEASDYWQDARRPHAQFYLAGRWTGADGCNGLGGTWSLDSTTGEWLARTGGQTQIYCKNVNVDAMVAPAAAVGFDGVELVFFDDEGTEIGLFVREG
jgi:heat shock protein HslJ